AHDQHVELGLGHAQATGDGFGDAALSVGHLAVRENGGGDNFQRHLDEITPTLAFAAELFQRFSVGEAVLLALLEQVDGELALGGVEPHLVHDLLGEGDLVPADAAVGLGNVAHEGEYGGKEGGLNPFGTLVAEQVIGGDALHAFVKIVAECGAEHCAKWPTHGEAEGATNDFSPPVHLVKYSRLRVKKVS